MAPEAGRITARLVTQRNAIERLLAAAALHDVARRVELEGAEPDATVQAFDPVGPSFDVDPARVAPILAWQTEEQLAEYSHPVLVDGCWR
jgi:hypothetical protein